MQQKNLINGQWLDSQTSSENINPSDTSDTIGTIFHANSDMVSTAIKAAKDAQQSWLDLGIEKRSDILMTIGNELIAQKQPLGELLAREEGKTKAEGIGEVDRAGRFFHYFAAEALRQMGVFADSTRLGVEVEVIKEPIGTVLLITPWNFPIALPAWKIAPALAFGNCVILKPAELTPASACALADIMVRAGVPNGVFQLLLGKGRDVGNQLLNADGIDAVSFTGSLNTGRIVAKTSAEKLRRFQLEMGSKNALVVLDDCQLEHAVNCAINGAFFGTGQKCTASSRIIVTKGIYTKFRQQFIAAAKNLVVGHALDSQSQIGPAVSQTQLDNNHHYLDIGKQEGATLAYQGTLAKMKTKGYYFSPVIFDNTDNQMRINREEIFAPITALIKADDYEHALSICNDSDYGLTAGIATASLKYATDFKRRAQSGCVMVNLPTAGTDYHVPFGGTKLSSFGPREQGQFAVDFYTKIKTAYINANC